MCVHRHRSGSTRRLICYRWASLSRSHTLSLSMYPSLVSYPHLTLLLSLSVSVHLIFSFSRSPFLSLFLLLSPSVSPSLLSCPSLSLCHPHSNSDYVNTKPDKFIKHKSFSLSFGPSTTLKSQTQLALWFLLTKSPGALCLTELEETTKTTWRKALSLLYPSDFVTQQLLQPKLVGSHN